MQSIAAGRNCCSLRPKLLWQQFTTMKVGCINSRLSKLFIDRGSVFLEFGLSWRSSTVHCSIRRYCNWTSSGHALLKIIRRLFSSRSLANLGICPWLRNSGCSVYTGKGHMTAKKQALPNPRVTAWQMEVLWHECPTPYAGLAATQEALESIASRWIQKGSLEGNEMDTSLAANASA